jgi:hypothetical protein
MLAPFQKSPERADAAARVKRWVRSRFSLGDDSTVLVTELESAQPGFPPLSTVVAFWTAERKHYHFRVFKPLEEVSEADLPPAWYREALAVTPGVDCGCC